MHITHAFQLHAAGCGALPRAVERSPWANSFPVCNFALPQALIYSSRRLYLTNKSIITALLLYVTGFEKGPQPRAVRRSPTGRLPPPGVQLPPEPGPHVPASTAAVAAGQVSGCAADSGCLPGLQQWGGCLQMGPPPHPACALAHWRS